MTQMRKGLAVLAVLLGLVHDPQIAAAIELTETFTGPNAASLTADYPWTTIGTQVLGITSNQAAVQTAGFVTGQARMDADVSSVNQRIVATLVFSADASGCIILGLALRQSASAHTKYYLRADYCPIETTFIYRLDKVVAGVDTTLASAGTPATGDVLRFEVATVEGNAVLKGYINDVLTFNFTDSSSPILAGTRCGLMGLKGQAGDTASTTALTCSDLVPASGLRLFGVGQ